MNQVWWRDISGVTYVFEDRNTIVRLCNVYGTLWCFIALDILVSAACQSAHRISNQACWFAASQRIATAATQMCYIHIYTQGICPVLATARNAHSRESSSPICSIRNHTEAWHQSHSHFNHLTPLWMFDYHHSHMHVVTIGYGISAFSGSF